MLFGLITCAIFFGAFGIVYPIVGVIVLRVMGDRRPLRELLSEL